MSRLIKLGSATVIAAAAALAPVSLATGPDADGEGLFRLNGACAQASECISSLNYICSTHNQDWQDYRVSSGGGGCSTDGTGCEPFNQTP